MKKMKMKQMGMLLLCAVMLAMTGCSAGGSSESSKEAESTPDKTAVSARKDGSPKAETASGSLTAMEMAGNMELGWNLGNTFDAYSNGIAGENAWGNPSATQELMHAVRAAGFDTVRIPVSYLGKVGEAPDYTVESAWLSRLQEVVDYALEADLYVIINIHHDGNNDKGNGAWIDVTNPDQSAIQAKFQKIWAQIAAQFADYDQRLVFESMNEIHDGSYQAPSGESGKTMNANINALNQIFVDTVRESGGKNADRCLLVPGYNTNIDYTIAGFVLPEDSAADRLMVSVHFYDPYQYALEEKMKCNTWGNGAPGNCGWGNEDFVDAQFDKLVTTYLANGIPVIVGEYGAINKHNDPYRNYYMEYVTKSACDRGLVPVYWDNGYNGDYGFALIDRNSGAVLHPGMMDAMNRAASGESYEIAKP